jgi:hypothetical protein
MFSFILRFNKNLPSPLQNSGSRAFSTERETDTRPRVQIDIRVLKPATAPFLWNSLQDNSWYLCTCDIHIMLPHSEALHKFIDTPNNYPEKKKKY